MKIGLIVDGESEFQAFKKLIPKLEAATGNQILGPLRADIQPKAKVAQIATASRSRLRIMQEKGVDRVIVALDLETIQSCPIRLAAELEAELANKVAIPINVVVKNRMFENWLVADVDALRAQPGRFAVSNTAEGRIAPNKADNVDALAMIKAMVRDGQYHKVLDSQRIFERADIVRIGSNSRSFRRLLRCIGHPHYLSSSRRPFQVDK